MDRWVHNTEHWLKLTKNLCRHHFVIIFRDSLKFKGREGRKGGRLYIVFILVEATVVLWRVFFWFFKHAQFLSCQIKLLRQINSTPVYFPHQNWPARRISLWEWGKKKVYQADICSTVFGINLEILVGGYKFSECGHVHGFSLWL